jgi:hypothetical protein
MTYFDSVYFGSLDFAPPISAPTVFATYNIVAGSVQLDLNGNALVIMEALRCCI